MRCAARSKSSAETGSDPQLIYLDASALVKVVVEGAGSASLRSWLSARATRVSSIITAVELRRAISRAAPRPHEPQSTRLFREADHLLAAVELIALTDVIARRAGELAPPSLRALDAIHLSTALEVAGLEALVTYDERLARAAKVAGLAVYPPEL